ncbi:HIT domain-containing protein [Candidatus Woesearchaeota archaeon]|nr:HIT domain-containing protein [Candidatus Woesearchaeota archaeon]
MPEQPQGRQPSPEEVAALQEKLKNMSPEELKEFQKKQCIFCQIISGKIQAKKIYEDDKSIGILDINPANPGHILLLPKEHYSVMPQIPEEEVIHLFMVAKFLSNAVLKSLEATGTNIIVANGPAAGQRAQHFMIHVIPRKEGDGIEFSLPQKKHSEPDLDKVADKIREKLAVLLKLKKEEMVKKEAKPAPIALPAKEAKKEAPKLEPAKPKLVEAVVKEEKPPEEEKKEPEKAAEKKKPKRKKRKKKEAAPAAEVKVIVEPGVTVVEKKPKKKKKKAKPKKKKTEKKQEEEEEEKPKEEEPKEKPKKEGEDLAVDLDDIARVLGI